MPFLKFVITGDERVLCWLHRDFRDYCPLHSRVEGEDPGNDVVTLSTTTFLPLLCSSFFNKLALLLTVGPQFLQKSKLEVSRQNWLFNEHSDKAKFEFIAAGSC